MNVWIECLASQCDDYSSASEMYSEFSNAIYNPAYNKIIDSRKKLYIIIPHNNSVISHNNLNFFQNSKFIIFEIFNFFRNFL